MDGRVYDVYNFINADSGQFDLPNLQESLQQQHPQKDKVHHPYPSQHPEQQLITSKEHARVKNQSQVEWTDPIPLPLHYNTDYHFEIYESHQFGYNPEELAVGQGTINVIEDDRFCTWEVATDRGNKLGYLSAKIRKKLRYSPNANTDNPQPQIVSVNSIIGTVDYTSNFK